jgi:hypothetical protein
MISGWSRRRPPLAFPLMWLDLRGALIERLAFLLLEGLFALPPAFEPGNGILCKGFPSEGSKSAFEGPGLFRH